MLFHAYLDSACDHLVMEEDGTPCPSKVFIQGNTHKRSHIQEDALVPGLQLQSPTVIAAALAVITFRAFEGSVRSTRRWRISTSRSSKQSENESNLIHSLIGLKTKQKNIQEYRCIMEEGHCAEFLAFRVMTLGHFVHSIVYTQGIVNK